MHTHITDFVLDPMSKDNGCFVERQSACVCRDFPSTLDSKAHIAHTEQCASERRSTNYTSPRPANTTMQRNLSFKAGGYFWLQTTSLDVSEAE